MISFKFLFQNILKIMSLLKFISDIRVSKYSLLAIFFIAHLFILKMKFTVCVFLIIK